MTTSALVFLDTETTGLSLDDDIWEFAAIRRDVGGTERALHLFIEHDTEKCAQLPESFRADHERRFPLSPHGREWSQKVTPRRDAARRINDFLQGRPHIVGAVPNFDTERLAFLLQEWLGSGWTPPWHYHLIDVENLAVGWLVAEGNSVPLPWNSDNISAALGVTVPEDERHTAMGDARWAMRLYDAVLESAR